MRNFSYESAAGTLKDEVVSRKILKSCKMSTYSQAVILLTGAFSLRKQRFWISALISAPTPPVWLASCTITKRPVFSTLLTMVSTSQGKIVRKSMSSTEAPRNDEGTRASREGGGEERRERAVSH